MKNKPDKTNAIRQLESRKLAFSVHTYENAVNGVEVADLLGEPHESVFKTLVTVGKSGEHYVFVIPVAEELDLKAAASAAGEKSIDMVKSKELLGLTGYIHGGCSPVGMKKYFRTFIHSSARELDKLFVSGGRIGMQIELSPDELAKVVPFDYAELVKRQS